jgi:hypothetical protein
VFVLQKQQNYGKRCCNDAQFGHPAKPTILISPLWNDNGVMPPSFAIFANDQKTATSVRISLTKENFEPALFFLKNSLATLC